MARHATSVVVTGIGLITGLGHDRVATWAAMRAGRCAIRPLDLPEFGPDRTFLGCPAPGVLPAPRVMDPVLVLLTVLVQQAAHDARMRREDRDPERTAALIGLSKGGIRSLSRL